MTFLRVLFPNKQFKKSLSWCILGCETNLRLANDWLSSLRSTKESYLKMDKIWPLNTSRDLETSLDQDENRIVVRAQSDSHVTVSESTCR